MIYSSSSGKNTEMRRYFPLLAFLVLPALSGCGWVVAADIATIPVLGRSIPDGIYSAVTGKDCSVVRLDRGQSFCRPTEEPPAPPPYCTRSLGTVDCWTKPNPFGAQQREVADGPRTLTPEQEAHRTRTWPGLF